mgnify:CR=1 FL=1
MAIKVKDTEEKSKLLEVLTKEYKWENLLLGVLATVSAGLALMIISGNPLLQINPNFPNQKIEVLGPPPSSGTRDAWVELVMEKGCKTFDWVKEMKKQEDNKKFIDEELNNYQKQNT